LKYGDYAKTAQKKHKDGGSKLGSVVQANEYPKCVFEVEFMTMGVKGAGLSEFTYIRFNDLQGRLPKPIKKGKTPTDVGDITPP
jgi:hypothetical protein